MTNESKKKQSAFGLSKELHVPSAKTNTIFKLMTKKNGGVNRIPYSSFEGIETIYDPGHEEEWQRDITIKNIKSRHSKTNSKGEVEIIEQVGDIEFDSSGVLVVKPQEYTKLVFMKRSNYCDTNKFRDKGTQAKWYEEAPGKSKTELLHKEKRIADCTQLVYKMNAKELQSASKAYSLNHNIPTDDMKHNLILEVKKDPDAFINKVGNKDEKIKLTIEKSMGAGLISMDLTNNTWIWNEDNEVITPFSPDLMEDESLLVFLSSTKGKNVLKRLNELTE